MRRLVLVIIVLTVCPSCSNEAGPAPQPKANLPQESAPQAPQFAPKFTASAGSSNSNGSTIRPSGPNAAADQTAAPVAVANAPGPGMMSDVKFDKPDVTVPLVGVVNDVLVGGSGRYLLLKMQSLRKIAVFDVREAKVITYVNAESDEFLVAAGATRFVVIDVAARTVKRIRYEQPDKIEAEAPLDDTLGTPQSAAMGVSSEGPIVLFMRDRETRRVRYEPLIDNVSLIELESLGRREVVLGSKLNRNSIYRGNLSPLQDGRTIYLMDGSEGMELRVGQSGALLNPSKEFFSGESVSYGGRLGIGVSRVRLMGENKFTFISAIAIGRGFPDCFWLRAWQKGREPQAHCVSLHQGTDDAPLRTFELSELKNMFETKGDARGAVSLDGRMHYCGPENSIVLVNPVAPEVHVLRIDAAQEVAKATRKLSFITSPVIDSFLGGQSFTHQLTALSNQGDVTYRLETGPEGMTVSPTGRIEWFPPDNAASLEHVVIAAHDATGQEYFHRLKLMARSESLTYATSDKNSTAVDPEASRVAIHLPAPANDLAVGGHGRFIVAAMNSVKQVAVIDVVARRIVQTLPMNDDRMLVAAGATRFVVYCGGQQQLTRWRFATLQKESTAACDVELQAIAMGCESEGPIVASISTNGGHNLIPDVIQLATLKFVGIQDKLKGVSYLSFGKHVAASADGRLLTSWDKRSAGDAYFLNPATPPTFTLTRQGMAGVPSADGRAVFSPLGISDYAGNRVQLRNSDKSSAGVGRLQIPLRIPLPSSSGQFYLTWPANGYSDASAQGDLELWHASKPDPLVTIRDVQLPPPVTTSDTIESGYGERFFCLPHSQAIVTVPYGDTRLLIHRFNLDEALQRANATSLALKPAPELTISPNAELAADSSAAPTTPDLNSPPIPAEREKISLKLPSVIDDSCVGGGGRYLAAWMQSVRQVALVDVLERKIVKLLPVDDGNVRIAAGKEKLVVWSGEKRLLSRYELATGERETTVPTTLENVEAMVLGCDADGPMLVVVKVPGSPNELQFIDVRTLAPARLTPPAEKGYYNDQLSSSADGRRFHCGETAGAISVAAIETNRPKSLTRGILSADGSAVYGSDYISRVDGQRMSALADDAIALPAATGALYFQIPRLNLPAHREQRTSVSLHIQGETSAVVICKDLDAADITRADFSGKSEVFVYHKRNYLLPAANAFVAIPATRDQLLIQRFNLEEELRRSDNDYLVVTSTAPTTFVPGAAWEYHPTVLSNRGGVTFRLESGPPGMTVAPDGRVAWEPPKTRQDEAVAVLAVSDSSGAEIAHTLRLLADFKPVASPTALPLAFGAEPRKSYLIKLPAMIDDICVGGGGRYLVALLKSRGQVAIVDLQQNPEAAEPVFITVDDNRFQATAGATKLVVALENKGILQRYDLATAKLEASGNVGPKLAAVVALGSATEGPLLVGFKDGNAVVPEFFDLGTLQPEAVFAGNGPAPRFGNAVWAASNGSLFFGRNGQSSFEAYLLRRDSAKAEVLRLQRDVTAGIPSPDGSVIYTPGGTITRNGVFHDSSSSSELSRTIIPAASGPLYLNLATIRDAEQMSARAKRRLTIHVQGAAMPLFELGDVQIPEIRTTTLANNFIPPPMEKRLHLLPESNALVTIPKEMDGLLVQAFNFDEELAKLPDDYLFVLSNPPPTVDASGRFEYQIDAKAKRGPVTFQLESGPSGLAVSPAGRVIWQTKPRFNAEEVVVIAVTDGSGKRASHTFKIRLAPGELPLAGTTAVLGVVAPTTNSGLTGAPAAATMTGPPTAVPSGSAATVPFGSRIRIWTSNDGAFSVEAELVKVADGKATLRRTDGNTVDVPLDRLSSADRDYVSEYPPPK